MFTGIIKEAGIVNKFFRLGPAYRLEVKSAGISRTCAIGGSVSVNGICLTLVEKAGDAMSFDVMEETVARSAMSVMRSGDTVNLEDSMKAGEAVGGHFVQGHVDCKGRIARVKKDGQDLFIEIGFPHGFGELIVEKGSIAIDGISLTLGEVSGSSFKVYIIPHTLKATNLGSKRAGDFVNLEFDIIGKYIARSIRLKADPKVTENFLRENGF